MGQESQGQSSALEELMTLEEVATRLHVETETVARYTREGVLKFVPVGRRKLIKVSEYNDYIRRQENKRQGKRARKLRTKVVGKAVA